jgi:hypothetical protein
MLHLFREVFREEFGIFFSSIPPRCNWPCHSRNIPFREHSHFPCPASPMRPLRPPRRRQHARLPSGHVWATLPHGLPPPPHRCQASGGLWLRPGGGGGRSPPAIPLALGERLHGVCGGGGGGVFDWQRRAGVPPVAPASIPGQAPASFKDARRAAKVFLRAAGVSACCPRCHRASLPGRCPWWSLPVAPLAGTAG